MNAPTLKAPFPYFGGKSRVAAAIWERFGRVDNFVEPFFGSGAVLLGCPWPGHTETVNDADGLLANFWRALRADPDAVAEHADYPVSELDLHARHRWLVTQRANVEQLLADPDWYDAKVAGWWVWGISQWIGGGWCTKTPSSATGLKDDGTTQQRRPRLGGGGRSGGMSGVHSEKFKTETGLPWKRPIVAGSGNRTHRGLGVHRASFGQLPTLGTSQDGAPVYNGVHKRSFGQLPKIGANAAGAESLSSGTMRQEYRSDPGALAAYLRDLAARLRRTRVTCGDFERVLGPSVTWRHGTTAVFLDPPYDRAERADVYAVESDAAHRAQAWAVANGENPLLRIALCGYDGEHAMPAGWTPIRWKAAGGYGSQADGRGRANAERETVWFSPHCLNPAELARDAMLRPLPARGSDFTGTLFDESETA